MCTQGTEFLANLKAIELEALQEKYYLNKRKQIELFVEKLQAIKDEFEKRDLSDIPDIPT